NGALAFVVNQGSNNVSIINTGTRAVIATVPVGLRPAGLSFTPNGSYVLVTNRFSGNVSVINTATHSVSTWTAASGPCDVAVTSDGTLAYVANQYSNSVTVHSVSSG